MPRFSIIIPVYNTEKYLEKCLNSVFNQSFDDYEVIVVNDGSTDGSNEIITKYQKKHTNLIYISKLNGGLSSARNVGIGAAKGDYLLFLDSDDFYSNNFLKKLSHEISDDIDIVRFQVQDVYDNGDIVSYSDFVFSCLDGVSSFKYLCMSHYVEIACAYCYRRSFWLKKGFKFAEGTYHEDFGLIPLVLINSNSSKCINVVGYNYYQRSGSIMNDIDKDKIIKKANDFLEHFKFLVENSKLVDGDLFIFNSYIANSVILKSTTLRGNDYKKYVNELRKIGAFDMLLGDTFSRKIKKVLIKISPKVYYRIVRRLLWLK